MSQQRPNARRASKRPTVARDEQKQVSGQSEPSSLPSIRPSNDDHAAWLAYWQEQNQPWRTEPEISPARRVELEERRAHDPDVEKGIYPFKGMKLDRADVEWLLATHAGGPVNWSNEQEREREGLDVRGADLQHADLRRLPLTRLRGGLTFDEWSKATEEQRSSAVVLMRGANLGRAQLAGANLRGAQLGGANLSEAQLERANLRGAQLGRANLFEAQLERADLRGAQLGEANLGRAQLAGADLSGAQLAGANLGEAQLGGAILYKAQLGEANLFETQLAGANLSKAQLAGANLSRAQLERATLTDIKLGDKQRIGPRIADAQWNDTNLAVVDWSQVTKFGDEWEAKQKQTPGGEKKKKDTRLNEYRAAVRANRQLAVALQAQGLNEEAAHFAYRAQRLQRIVLRRQWRQWRVGSYLFSGFLDLIAGYGYRPGRTVLWYLFVIVGFAVAYFAVGHLPPFPDAFVFSLMSFHGRGFFPSLSSETSLHNQVVEIAAIEAVVGLLIEISFIATFTQRYFGK
jgi:uncharacterized protein YjbI with pentapeptide repeats